MLFPEERPLFILEGKLGCKWENLHRADKQAETAKCDLLEQLKQNVGRFETEDANLVVFGSMARSEWIDWKSDLDWTYLIDGQTKSEHLNVAQRIRSALALASRVVGQIHVSEVNFASKHDLISLEARKAFSIVSHLIPESLPAVLESRWKTGPTPEEVQCEIDIAGDLLRSTVLAG